MAYCIHDLLELASSEGAQRVLIEVGRPPIIELKGEEQAVEGPEVTRENATEMFRKLATAAQLKELDRCGDVRFIHESKIAKFGVAITIDHQRVTLEARNLSVPPT